MRYNYTCPFQVIAIKNIGGVTFLCSASMAYQAHNCNRFSWLQLISGGSYQSLYNLFIATQQGQVQGCISDLIFKETAENLSRLNVVDGNGDRHHSDQTWLDGGVTQTSMNCEHHQWMHQWVASERHHSVNCWINLYACMPYI